jgi:oxaloacetate decarboxylase gamma subunit
METNLVIEGLKFMLLGMGIVFAFLIIMIIAMNIMSSIIHKFFPEPKVAPAEPKTQQNNNDKKVVAAITAAIMHHREA